MLIEPLAGGIHAALLAARWSSLRAVDEPIVAVRALARWVRCPSLASCATSQRRRWSPVPGTPINNPKSAGRLGAHDVVPAARLTHAVRRHDGCRMIGDTTAGGAHAVIDAVGSNNWIATALRITRPRGRTVLMGMPAR